MDFLGLCIIQQIGKYLLGTGLLKETRLQIIPVMNVKLNKP